MEGIQFIVRCEMVMIPACDVIYSYKADHFFLFDIFFALLKFGILAETMILKANAFSCIYLVI